MLSEERKEQRRLASKRWYEKNKDTYKNPDPEKRKLSLQKAALAYYYRNKGKIISKSPQQRREEIRIKKESTKKNNEHQHKIDLIKTMNDLVKAENDFLFINRKTPLKPLALLF